tara:strand:- start:1405 stop:1686 length:282 start_codon:yes stop_codon:yes gene_type:complete
MAENVNTELDRSLGTVHDGQQARLVRNYTEDWILTHEEDTLLRAITSFRGGTLTAEAAICTIAELSGLRAFKEDMQSKVRQGVMEAERELGAG